MYGSDETRKRLLKRWDDERIARLRQASAQQRKREERAARILDGRVVLEPKRPTVAIVGFGPSGAVAAGLLGERGIRTFVCDRLHEVYDKPRAIALDHEITQATDLRNRLALLKAACRWAWKKHAICDADPTARMQLPAVRNERHVYARRDQVGALARAADRRDVRALILAAFYTGMRLGEICGLQIEDVDRQARTVVIRDRKDPRRKWGNHQTVPLLHGSFDIVMRQPRTSELAALGKIVDSGLRRTDPETGKQVIVWRALRGIRLG